MYSYVSYEKDSRNMFFFNGLGPFILPDVISNAVQCSIGVLVLSSRGKH
jgi:hypothetical protein